MAKLGILSVPIKQRLQVVPPPWTPRGSVSIGLSISPDCGRDKPADVRRRAAEDRLATLPETATWVWSDGSAEGGVIRGGGSAVIFDADYTREVRVPAGLLCSSTRADLFALRAALDKVDSPEDGDDSPFVVCTDSSAALSLLDGGPAAQSTQLGADIWRRLTELASRREAPAVDAGSLRPTRHRTSGSGPTRQGGVGPPARADLPDVTTGYRAASRLAKK